MKNPGLVFLGTAMVLAVIIYVLGTRYETTPRGYTLDRFTGATFWHFDHERH